MTLAPARPAGLPDDAAAGRKLKRGSPQAAVNGRRTWWQWLDFESKLMAQVWAICCAQILVFVVGGLAIHVSLASRH